jgi:hypothetical protein
LPRVLGGGRQAKSLLQGQGSRGRLLGCPRSYRGAKRSCGQS